MKRKLGFVACCDRLRGSLGTDRAHVDARQQQAREGEKRRIREETEASKQAELSATAAKRAASEAADRADAMMRERLSSAAAIDAALLHDLCDLLMHRLQVTGVYICRKEASEGPLTTAGDDGGAGGGGDDDDGSAASQVRYLAASAGSEHVLGKFLVGKMGVTADAWKLPKVAGADDADADVDPDDPEAVAAAAAKRAALPKPELPIIHIHNVLREPRIVFHGLPRLGEFLAVPCRYSSLDHAGCIPPNAAKPDDAGAGGGGDDDDAGGGDDDAAAAAAAAATAAAATGGDELGAIPAGIATDKDLAICLDTLGKDRRLTPADVTLVKGWAQLLGEAMERCDSAGYASEYAAHRATAAQEAEAAAAIASAKADDEAAGDAAKAAILDAAGPEASAAEDIKTIAAAAAVAAASASSLRRVRARVAEVGSRRVPPPEAAVRVAAMAVRLCGVPAETMGDAGARDPKRAFWPSVAQAMRESMVESLTAFDPLAESLPSAEEVAASVEGVDEEALRAASVVFPPLLAFCKAGAEALTAVKAKKQREAEEAAAKTAAAAAAAAAAADGGSAAPADGDGDDA